MEKQQMYELAGLISDYLMLPFFYAVEYYFYDMFLGFKGKSWKFILCALSLTAVEFSTMKIDSQTLQLFIDNMLWLIIICFLCKGNFIIKFYSFIVQNTVRLLICLTFLTFDFNLIPIVSNINILAKENIIIYFVKNIFNDFIYTSILFIVLKNICSLLKPKEHELNLYQGLYLTIPCLSIFSLALIFFSIQKLKIDNKNYYLPYIFPNLYYLLPFVCIALLISILIIAFTFKKTLEGEQEVQNNMIMKQQLKLQLNHCKNFEGLYGEVRSVIHDMNNHIACLSNLATSNNVEEIKKYIYNIKETVHKLDFEMKTGNAIADAIINEKYNISKTEGINFVCNFIMPQQTILEPIDICIILSNSLDNAIEACVKITDDNIPKTIHIRSIIRDIYLIIEITNSTTTKIKYVNNKIISTKTDTINHGIGLYNIEKVVKKYNGVFDIIEEKNKFTINIMLRCIQK